MNVDVLFSRSDFAARMGWLPHNVSRELSKTRAKLRGGIDPGPADVPLPDYVLPDGSLRWLAETVERFAEARAVRTPRRRPRPRNGIYLTVPARQVRLGDALDIDGAHFHVVGREVIDNGHVRFCVRRKSRDVGSWLPPVPPDKPTPIVQFP